jgi:PTH1 family peptidyl-tRNA hydrolase
MPDDRFLVIGLGNPGPRYAATRHNAGYMVADLLGARIGAKFKSHRANVDIIEGRLAEASIVLAKPRSFMNDSGGPVVNAARFFKIAPEQVIIIHDDLDLPFGTLKLKRGGGDGGHNGLKSITSALGSKDYVRVRLGIGRPPGRQDAAEYVLREFSVAERRDLPVDVDRAADAVELVLSDGLEAAQLRYHSPLTPAQGSRPNQTMAKRIGAADSVSTDSPTNVPVRIPPP